jgi:hypothetical protein
MNEAAKGKGHRAESRRRRWTNERIKPKVPAKVACSVIPGATRNPDFFENPGFRVALRLPGMTTSLCFREFCRNLTQQLFSGMKLKASAKQQAFFLNPLRLALSRPHGLL